MYTSVCIMLLLIGSHCVSHTFSVAVMVRRYFMCGCRLYRTHVVYNVHCKKPQKTHKILCLFPFQFFSNFCPCINFGWHGNGKYKSGVCSEIWASFYVAVESTLMSFNSKKEKARLSKRSAVETNYSHMQKTFKCQSTARFH